MNSALINNIMFTDIVVTTIVTVLKMNIPGMHKTM